MTTYIDNEWNNEHNNDQFKVWVLDWIHDEFPNLKTTA